MATKDTSNIVIALRAVYENNKNESPDKIKTEMTERYVLENKNASSTESLENTVDTMYTRFVYEDEVIGYLSNGHTVEDAVFSFGISPSAVYAIIKTAKAFGIEFSRINTTDKRRGHGVTYYRKEIESRIRNGASNQEIAKEFDVRIGNVSQFRQKLFREDVSIKGHSDIKIGRCATMTREEKDRATKKQRDTVQKNRASFEEIVNKNQGIIDEVYEWCCVQIHDKVPFNTIIHKAENLGDMYAALVTTSYLEQIKYGNTIASVIDNCNNPDVMYSFDGEFLGYEYSPDAKMKTIIRSRRITKEVAQLFFDENKEFCCIMEEGTMSVINGFLRTGILETPSDNTTLRVVGIPESQKETLRKIAFGE